MAASDMMNALMALCEEKHIDQGELIHNLEESLAESYGKVLRLPFGAKVTIDRESGSVYVYELVPDDDSMILDEEDEHYGEYTRFTERNVTPSDASRFAAQHAKSVINEMVRNSSRRQIFDEFKDRIGELITGTVLQTTPEFTFVKIREGVEAELPYFDLTRHPDERNERPAGERYSHNEQIRAIIIDVRDPDSKQAPIKGERQRPTIVLSRTHPNLITRLFELEVPEVYDHVVEVRSVARDAGVRSKVAVSSVDPRLDPVGACVGPKGSRVRTVVSELKGERVDVVLWDDDPARCVANALSPARVSRVVVDPETKHATVIVPDDQLTLAIGKKGQNARLAARLTGMHIDIKNETLADDILGGLGADLDLIGAEERRCHYVGPTGIKCRNLARPGSNYCGIHESHHGIEDEQSAEADALR
ncbi:transcription termination factor NusA [Olsenella sp. HMSC062G07]|uniref:transcription termination factor NusA n=1 Tax=Olsenella sp. HMSC062G07 TaxID=1739330 RepID=UPI0008A4E263|nr:transcription termination factor NusA [Olsenella sp. HMSC062G07]OFK24614.1 antitermination protein NusA [Olsenella sp. HMSC062G07]